MNPHHKSLIRIVLWLTTTLALGLLSLTIGCGGVVTSASRPEPGPKPIRTPVPAATVYVQNQSNGVTSYTSTNGQLTPTDTFQLTNPNESIVGSTQNFLVTYSGDDYADPILSILHTYSLSGKPLSSIDTQSFPGCSDLCYFTKDVTLSGSQIYTGYAGPNDQSDPPGWAGVQTFNLDAQGNITFLSDSPVPPEVFYINTPSGAYGYGFWADQGQNTGVSVFSSDTLTGLQYLSTTVLQPSLNPVGDSRGNVAVVLDNHLASYTTDPNGNLTTTNNLQSLPATEDLTVAPNNQIGVFASMNPSGTVVALAINSDIQLFHFNGSEEPSNFTTINLSPTSFVTDVTWDTNGNLYAIDGSTGDLHVFSIGETIVSEAAGSPYKVNALEIVVAQ